MKVLGVNFFLKHSVYAISTIGYATFLKGFFQQNFYRPAVLPVYFVLWWEKECIVRMDGRGFEVMTTSGKNRLVPSLNGLSLDVRIYTTIYILKQYLKIDFFK